MRLLTDLDVKGKKVFMRADLDVPLETLGDDRLLMTNPRLVNLKPTVDWLFDHGADKIIVGGHIGRPTPKANTAVVDDSDMEQFSLESTIARALDEKPLYYDENLTTDKIRSPLERLLGRSVIFGQNLVKRVIEDLELLENLRFWPGEEANDVDFAKELAALADVYVNEAFGVAHRQNASVVALAGLMPHAAGLHFQKEVETLSVLVKDPKKPLVAVVGGAKIETKVPVIENLAQVADYVLIGGYLPVEIAKENLKFGDNVIVGRLDETNQDLSKESADQFAKIIASAKSVVWNGPMGVFEQGHEYSSVTVANAIVSSGAYSVVGGGETTSFLNAYNLTDKFSFVSTGGGAMLEFLAGHELPGIAALS